ncbi:hypothetical protein HEK616_07950 [Streptomyces nigrescens]|uniref:Uncharacterized protein n=1 Tax=Streptomyces nigrescens TaxID=1920 RepID=A0ABN6QQU0_STRNI|nr:hypothetical protein HEK616_07950 [Streptomyces nigrescens]
MTSPGSRGEDYPRRDLDAQVESTFEEQSAIVRFTSNPVILASLGSAPFAGGIASLLSDNARKRQEIRYRNFLIDFAKYVDARWDDLQRHIDEDFVSSEEFVTVMAEGLEEAGRTADETKLRYLRDYIINSAMLDRPDIKWRDVFKSYLGQLSGTHLVCLQHVFDRQQQVSETDRMGQVRSDDVPISINQFSSRNPGVDETLARLCFGDLANTGLLVDWRSLGNRDGVFQEEYCITGSGLHFMWFMEGKWRMLRD